MKKILLLPIMCLTLQMFAQETSTRKNDILVGPVEIIAGGALNISYERTLNSDSGIGLSLITGLEFDDDYKTTLISPFYRLYFGENYASGFFLEGFMPISSGSVRTEKEEIHYDNNNIEYISYTEVYKKETSFGLGIGIGGKWALKRNIIFELSGGIARKVITEDVSPVTGKWMLGLGYRF